MDEQILEKMRRGVKRRRQLCMVLAAISFVCFLKLFYGASAVKAAEILPSAVMTWGFDFIVSAVAGCGVFALLWRLLAERAHSRFCHAFKCRYVMQTIEALPGFRELQYIPERGFAYDDIRNAAVVSCGDEKLFQSEDLLTGFYEDVPFRISDVNTMRMVRKARGKSEVVDVFSGQVMQFGRFDGRKQSDGHVQIFQKDFLSDLRGWTAEHKIQTEHALFNQKFQVYAASEHNAFYILTPQMMEKIMAFSEAVGEQTAITFRGSAMFVAIAWRRSMFDPLDDIPVAQQRERILEDIGLLQKAKELLIAAQDVPDRKRETRC